MTFFINFTKIKNFHHGFFNFKLSHSDRWRCCAFEFEIQNFLLDVTAQFRLRRVRAGKKVI